MNILLTGEIQVGKTTVCQALAELARRRGHQPDGVVTPALYDGNGAKVGFEALAVADGQQWLLARTDEDLGGPRVGRYSFDPDGLARALMVLRQAAAGGGELLLVDEVGPLELEQGEGFAPVLEMLPTQGPRHTLIVVRLALMKELRQCLGDLEFVIFRVTRENRELLPHLIAQELWPND